MSWPKPKLWRPSCSVDVGALDRPDDGNVSSPRRLDDLRSVHKPDRHIAAGVLPENVSHAVAVEVAGLDDRPAGQLLGTAPIPPAWATCAPFISQIARLPLLSRHRMSLFPLPATDHTVGTFPTPADCMT
jgi:hypothetical protein